jgi:hypothetical protein
MPCVIHWHNSKSQIVVRLNFNLNVFKRRENRQIPIGRLTKRRGDNQPIEQTGSNWKVDSVVKNGRQRANRF